MKKKRQYNKSGKYKRVLKENNLNLVPQATKSKPSKGKVNDNTREIAIIKPDGTIVYKFTPSKYNGHRPNNKKPL